MAIYRKLKSVIDTKQSVVFEARSFVTVTTSVIPSHNNPLSLYPLPYYSFAPPCSSRRFLFPLSKWILPFQGPLFLSSPPWKLSQSATPLYLRGNSAVLRKVEKLNFNLRLDLLRKRIGPAQRVLDRVEESKVDDSQNGFAESFVNLPNLISMTRLVSGPVIGWMITNEMYSSAFVALALSGATDWLDGYVARKMGIDSVVGSYLDPLADKVLIGSVVLAMVHMDLLHPGLVALVVLRDVALVGGAVYHRASSLGWKWSNWYDFFNLDGTRPEKIKPLFISKVNTVLQLVLVAAALIQPELGTQETQSYISYLSWLVASTTVASTAAYGAHYMGNKSALLARKTRT